MTRHRSPSPARFSVPAIADLPAPTMSLPHRIDVAVTEWTVDLSGEPVLTTSTSPTTVGAVGFVDYDTVDSVHETTGSTAMVPR